MMKKYPTNWELIREGETLATGANIHEVRSKLNLYQVRIHQYNRDYKPFDWEYVKESEKMLEDLIIEMRK